jgi:hypothetical protein
MTPLSIRGWRLGSKEIGGETGIRTLGTVASTTVFETAPFNHSGTSPHVRPVALSDGGGMYQKPVETQVRR